MRLNRFGVSSAAGAACFLTVALGLVAAGCGSSTAQKIPDPQPTAVPQTSGSARIRVQWPSRTGRIIPIASESVVVVLQDAQKKELVRATATRPDDNASTSDVRFSTVPVGDYFVTAAAYPQNDGTGTAQAAATVPLRVDTNAETLLELSLNSTISRLSLTQGAPATDANQTFVLVAAAQNASGAVVLTRSSQFTWQSSDAGIATVDANGVVTVTGAGLLTVTARDTESGTTAQIVLNIDRAAQ